MAKFHINPQSGNPGPCGAQEGNCPFGGESEHYDSADQARAVYESQMNGSVFAASSATKARDNALKAHLTLQTLNSAIEDGSYEVPSHQLHTELADAHRGVAEASETYRLHATDEAEKAAWGRTAAHAAREQAAHENAAFLLTPRSMRPGADERVSRKLELFEKARVTAEDFDAVREDYFESPSQPVKLASQLHAEWQEARKFEPRMKPDGNGGEVDIANTDFIDLPAQWQDENMKAAKSALSRVEQYQGNIELAAAAIHEDWLERNGDWAEPHQKVAYVYLSEEEKEKDRVLARSAYKLIGN